MVVRPSAPRLPTANNVSDLTRLAEAQTTKADTFIPMIAELCSMTQAYKDSWLGLAKNLLKDEGVL